MYEELIQELDTMGVDYEENEMGDLVINIADIDKTDLVAVVSLLNDAMYDYSITDSEIVVAGTGATEPEEDLEDLDLEMPDITDMI